jgi:hypothetical protein
VILINYNGSVGIIGRKKSMTASSSKAAKVSWPTALVWIASLGLVVLATVSFMLSFDALLIVASWGHVTPAMRWGVPVFIDGAIVVYTAVILVQQSRGNGVVFPTMMLTVFTLVSLAGNGAVAWSAGDPGQWQTWAGTFIAALPPIGVFAATHMTVRIIVAPKTVPVQMETAEVGIIEKEDPDIPALTVPALGGGPTELPSVRRRRAPQGRPAKTVETLTSVADRDEQIAELSAQKLTQREIAEKLGIGKTTVARVQEGLREAGRLARGNDMGWEAA